MVCKSFETPTIFKTRLKLYTKKDKENSPLTFSTPRSKQYPIPNPLLRLPNGCSQRHFRNKTTPLSDLTLNRLTNKPPSSYTLLNASSRIAIENRLNLALVHLQTQLLHATEL